MSYKIVIEVYRNKRDIEEGKPHKVVDSGFTDDLTLKEAQILVSKMSEYPLRINKIVEVK